MLRLMTDRGMFVSDFAAPSDLCNFLKATKNAEGYKVKEIEESTKQVLSECSAMTWALYHSLELGRVMPLVAKDLEMLHGEIKKLHEQLNPKPVDVPAVAPQAEPATPAQ